MILKKELIEIARAKGVKTKTIDKDWILGHFLNAMFGMLNMPNTNEPVYWLPLLITPRNLLRNG